MRRIRSRIALLQALALTACAHARSVAEPITTDRPDATEGTDLVAPGWTQIEGGMTAYRASRFNGASQSFGELLVRVGAARRLEARLEIPSVVTMTGSKRQYSDPGLGIKTPLLIPADGASRAIPALSLLAATSVSTNWSAGPALGTPEIVLASAWSLSDRLDLAANAVTQPFASGSGEQWVGITIATGVALTERLGSYLEFYHLSTPTMNGGVTYRLTPDFQLDARAGMHSFRQPGNRTGFVGVGFATRW